MRKIEEPILKRQSGIALMVVMVVFIILYLVVFQLHYTTKVNEKESKARCADMIGSLAIESVAQTLMTQLAEDAQSSASSSGATGAAGASGVPAAADPGAGASKGGKGAAGAKDSKAGAPGVQSSAGADPTAIQPGGGSSGPPDFLGKPLFTDNEQSLNGITVKISIEDNERKFDLNQLWSYPPSMSETLDDSQKDLAAADKKIAEADPRLQGVLKQAGATTGGASSSAKGSSGAKSTKSTKSRASSSTQVTARPEDASSLDQASRDDVGAGLEFDPPADDRRQETIKMLERAIEMMIRMNVQNGFTYQREPAAGILAQAIELYCYKRRSQPAQNFIHLPSELLNVLADLGESPEVYYGPKPPLAAGEEFTHFDDIQQVGFTYQKDNYGDLVGQAMVDLDPAEEAEREEMKSFLKEQQGMFGQFVNLPELGRMGNPLTRGQKEPTEVQDAKGNYFIATPPMPLGLVDLFTTFSSGKINLNTASVPILYSLLPLIIETEANGPFQAQTIAINIWAYRWQKQPELDPNDPTQVEKTKSLAGAPTRAPAATNPDGSKKSAKDLIAQRLGGGSTGAAGALSAEDLAAASQGGSTNLDTNYFTSLQQLKLTDGEDGGKGDYLTEQGSATTTSALERKTPLEKVLHDYGQVMVFGSTFFTATLKSKSDDSPAIRTGSLVLLRDLKRKRIEVIEWKELQQ